MSDKKIVEIPFPNFLYKFLKKYENEKHEIEIPFHLPTPLTKSDKLVIDYFRFAEHLKYKKHKIITNRQNIAHQYGVTRLFYQLFYSKLYDFIDAHLKTHFEIKTAIQLFCNQYNISEDDYKMETFIKKYQRHRKKPFYERLFV